MYELNEYCSTANVLFSPGLSWSAAVLHWNLTDLRRTRRHRDTTIDPGSLGRSGQLQRLTMSCLSCLSDDPWWPSRHVFLSARNGQGFPTMQVRLLLQSGTMSFSVRQSLPMVCGSDDLSDVFSRSKPMISEEARKKQQRDAGILSDSIGFYRILRATWRFLAGQRLVFLSPGPGFLLQWHSLDDPFIPISEARHVAEHLGVAWHWQLWCVT